MKKKVISITGSRAEYGSMRPVFEEINRTRNLDLELIVTGMHLLPAFRTSFLEIKKYRVSRIHVTKDVLFGKYSMPCSFAKLIQELENIYRTAKPDILLLQGDRMEMLAGAIVAALNNIPIVHMSGGDFSGSIDDSFRNAISKLAHIHLVTCENSTKRLLSMGEGKNRIYKVGEPELDVIRTTKFIPKHELLKEFNLDPTFPIIIAIQHPVINEANLSSWQIEQTIQALIELKYQTIFIYPNTDSGGNSMVEQLERYKNNNTIRVIPHIEHRKFLSLMKIASVMVGNSSSGIIVAPSLKLAAVNIGTRQFRRLRAKNVIDVDHDKNQIKRAIAKVLFNKRFRFLLKKVINPYGGGHTAEKTADILSRLRITNSLITKWIPTDECFLN